MIDISVTPLAPKATKSLMPISMSTRCYPAGLYRREPLAGAMNPHPRYTSAVCVHCKYPDPNFPPINPNTNLSPGYLGQIDHIFEISNVSISLAIGLLRKFKAQ
jgi:hypothetical protein